MGPSTTQTAEDDSDGRLSPEPPDDSSRHVPTVGILRRATNLTTSSSSTEPLSLGDERNYSTSTWAPLPWDVTKTQYITQSTNTSKGVDVPGCWRRQVVLSLGTLPSLQRAKGESQGGGLPLTFIRRWR